PTFKLVMYRFYRLVTILLEKPTIFEAISSMDVQNIATSLLDLIRADLAPPPVPYHHSSRKRNANGILPRILCMAGLQFPRSNFPERKCRTVLSFNVFSFYLDYCSD